MKQDNTTRIGPVIIGRSFKQNTSQKYPHERLIEFLKVDKDNITEIDKFCANYKFVPRDVSQGWRKGFEEEQHKLKALFDKYESNELQEIDIKAINEELSVIRLQLNFTRNESKTLTSDLLYGSEVHGNSIASLYVDFMNYIVERSLIKKCPYCGTLFIRNKSRPNTKYCNLNCQEAYKKYKKRKRYKNRP